MVPSIQKNWKKPTIRDAQKGVIVEVESDQHIDSIIADRFGSNDNEIQHYPMIFFIKRDNNPDEFVVKLHLMRYSFNHLNQALDVTFKMFNVFRIDYPVQSKQFYVFLNELFYKIEIKVKKSSKALILSSEVKKAFFSSI